MNFLKLLFTFSILSVSCLISCHAPEREFDADIVQTVAIYPNNNTVLQHNHTYTFYSVVTPNEASNLNQYYWEYGGRVENFTSGNIKVEDVRKALGSEYTIPDDSQCFYCTFKVTTYDYQICTGYLSYKADNLNLPNCTLYFSIKR